MVSLEIQERRRKLIDNLLFDEDVALQRETFNGCAVGYANTLVYGYCMGPLEGEDRYHEPYEAFAKAYDLAHSYQAGFVVEANDRQIWETDRERAIRMGHWLEKFWKDEGEGQSA